MLLKFLNNPQVLSKIVWHGKKKLVEAHKTLIELQAVIGSLKTASLSGNAK